ncbi:hypothetical protein OOZ15_10215 [Galbibacter sp. EGI 63066]|uniref:hypothetical protein n=1 Tax=Galbibacter sp. EGI 63066 TaxID=2993559 RepID=UPI002248D377|nr:hypothetical protein [Galbibacter sp. EGI 63066]MCX2680314.1 hypothetical protein [Galbibacter sp. EGI 63066]
MGTKVFKRLFEIQLLQDYFLTSEDGMSFFDKNEEEKNEILRTKLIFGMYDIRDMFFIKPVGNTTLKLNEYKLRLHKTPLGFIVGVEVNVENQAGETLYKPVFGLDESISLSFCVKPRLSFFKSITNVSFTPEFPAIYYFTNKDKEVFNETVVPAYTSLPISDKVMPHQNGKKYEMGALVDFGGTIREAIQHTDEANPAHWEDIDDRRFVTEADRILLPHNFIYSFKKEANVTEFEITLEDLASTEIKKITETFTDPITSILLNFTKVDENDDESDDIADGIYNLKVKVNGGAEVIYTVYLNDDLYQKDSLGVIDIRFDELNSPFSLLDASGFLKTKIDASDQKISHPVFEVRFKNRKTYWRYNREGDFSPAEIAATSAYLQHQPEKLISIKPRSLTETLIPFQNGTSLMLPHPRMPSVKVEQDKIYSEIYINQSNRLLSN